MVRGAAGRDPPLVAPSPAGSACPAAAVVTDASPLAHAIRLLAHDDQRARGGSFPTQQRSIRWEFHDRTAGQELDVDAEFLAFADEGRFPDLRPADQACSPAGG
ncbi:hypothetical protein ND748_20840 [Frankia sp. AiPs1]|uniref:hypothetical protein n=1 Tax=Frankia sp. AiPs1 TaxID=573493 RepID=UPI002044214C|nr:hypothetical protein [Frankia sp. AiPs1]MCM3924106.1 hypothetical protein [Frankia sp. AiPs1]